MSFFVAQPQELFVDPLYIYRRTIFKCLDSSRYYTYLMATACIIDWNGAESGLDTWILDDNLVFPRDWHFYLNKFI